MQETHVTQQEFSSGEVEEFYIIIHLLVPCSIGG